MLTSLVKGMIEHTPIKKWEYVDRQLEVRRKRKRIEFIEQFLPKNGIGAELGVFKGHLSPTLLKYAQPQKLHLVDPWYFLSSRWEWANGNQSTVDALITILQTFKKEIEDGRILIHVGDDLQVVATFPDGYFDWVYIDTSHQYEHTKQELHLLESKVKEDGIIAGDDWQPDPNRRHYGVYQAVNEFVSTGKYTLIYSDNENRQWAIKKS